MIKSRGGGALLDIYSSGDARPHVMGSRVIKRGVPAELVRMAAATLVCVGPACLPTARADDTDSVKLEEIVVTASKREELLSKTPIAVSAITADALDQQG